VSGLGGVVKLLQMNNELLCAHDCKMLFKCGSVIPVLLLLKVSYSSSWSLLLFWTNPKSLVAPALDARRGFLFVIQANCADGEAGANRLQRESKHAGV
jgi:hypothetical protein